MGKRGLKRVIDEEAYSDDSCSASVLSIFEKYVHLNETETLKRNNLMKNSETPPFSKILDFMTNTDYECKTKQERQKMEKECKQFQSFLRNVEKSNENLDFLIEIKKYDQKFGQLTKKVPYSEESYVKKEKEFQILAIEECRGSLVMIIAEERHYSILKKQAIQIYQTYIEPNSMHEVSLPYKLKNELKQYIFVEEGSDETPHIHPVIFKEPLIAIATVIEYHSYYHYLIYKRQRDEKMIEKVGIDSKTYAKLVTSILLMIIGVAGGLVLFYLTPRTGSFSDQFVSMKYRTNMFYWARSFLWPVFFLGVWLYYSYVYGYSNRVFIMGRFFKLVHNNSALGVPGIGDVEDNKFLPYEFMISKLDTSVLANYRWTMFLDLVVPSIMISTFAVLVFLIIP